MKQMVALLIMMITLTACSVNEAEMIANKKTAVVAILSQGIENTNQGSVGTGFLIRENYIVTNFHVAGNTSTTLKVAMENNDETYDAELMYGDKDTDVAVIKLKDWDKFEKENPQLTFLEYATSMPDVTDTVWAIGHPWGLFYSVSKGIVSMDARKSPNSFPMWWVQTDAHVFQGNSGGPLLNEDGKVIGMNSVMLAQEGGSYGFAIPYILIQKVINDLEKYKEVRWANFGISIGVPGVTIKEITADGAAKAAGFEVGDKIVAVRTAQTHKTPVANAFDLISFLSTLDYEDKVQVTIERDSNLITLEVQPKFKLSSDYPK